VILYVLTLTKQRRYEMEIYLGIVLILIVFGILFAPGGSAGTGSTSSIVD
jgi:hypothetical protein